MSPSMRFTGLPVSEGMATGRLHIADVDPAASATPDEVAGAFAAVAAARSALAGRLRRAGRTEEAAIIDIGALIAADPALAGPAAAAVRGGSDAAAAVRQAVEAQAAVIEALPAPELAERASDVRQVADAVLDHLSSTGAAPRPAGDFILVRREVSPAELVEFAEAGLVGAVSVGGGASSHAAIIARGLGIPMVTGVDAAVLAVPAGQQAILDADAAELIVGPAVAELAAASGNGAGQRQAQAFGPARTADGREITVLCNVASAAETRRGLAGGAAVDTAVDTAVGAASGAAAGLAALLAHRTALPDQLQALLETGGHTRLSILIPMVSSLDEVRRVRDVPTRAAEDLGTDLPRLGIMVELQATAAAAGTFATAVDFFSVGTNDLTGQVLGLGRRDPAATPALAAHPRVLALISCVADAGRRAGIPVSVCGDSAADPLVLPLLVGLGVDTVSVPAARVQRVRSWVAELDTAACAALAATALRASTADEVWKLVPPL